MKKIFVILFACFAMTVCNEAIAQNPNLKWGKPSQTEWSLQAWGEAPDAEAVILNKTMNVNYKISRSFQSYTETGVSELSLSSIENLGSNENQSVVVTYDVKVRTKILKNEGSKYANLDLVYFEMEDDLRMFDEITHMKVVVFSKNEKGKVQRREIKASNFTDERVDKNYKVRHIVVPDTKAGDIVECQYELSSTRLSFLYDCSFQEDIPVLYAKCDMDIPAFLQFNMTTPIHPFIKSTVEPGSVAGEQLTGDLQAPKRYPSNHYIIEGHDILPKGLDLQRKNPTVDAAKVEAGTATVMKTFGAIKNPNVAKPAPMPIGMSHLMIAK